MQTAVILLAVLGSAFAVPTNVNRIVGGTNTTVQEYPYIANLKYGTWGVWWHQTCAGSLLTTRSVLTAGHCFYSDATNVWRVYLGSSFASTGGNQHTVSQVIIHNSFRLETMDFNIAIIRLTNPTTYSQSIQPARVPGPNYVVPIGDTLTAIGWGTTELQGSPSEQLQKVDLNAFNQTVCANRYRELQNQPGFDFWPSVTERMICAHATGGGKDACHGDDGGPLAHHNDIIAGIQAHGYGCGHDYYPLVATRVNLFVSWIQANV